MTKISLNQLIVLIDRVEEEIGSLFREFQKGAVKRYKKTALLTEEIILDEITVEDHESYLAKIKELRVLADNLKELRRNANRSTMVTFVEVGEEKTLSIADAIEHAKFVQRLANAHNALTRQNPKNVFTSVSEADVTEYLHDIEGYKELVKAYQKTKDSITQAIQTANVETFVEVEGAEEFL